MRDNWFNSLQVPSGSSDLCPLNMLQDENEMTVVLQIEDMRHLSGTARLASPNKPTRRDVERVARGCGRSSATRRKEQRPCFAFPRRISYERRGATTARRAERKHDLSLRVAKDSPCEGTAGGRKKQVE